MHHQHNISLTLKRRPLYGYTFILCLTAALSCSAQAQLLIPTDSSSPLYYQLGGGADVSLPPRWDTNVINLDASLSLHPGYQCGVFNPAISLRTTLNQLGDALKDAEKKIVQNATAAVAEFPLYELARANPTLYNILNNNLLRAHEKIRIATKSCEQMQNDIDHHRNPYHDWMRLAVGDQWEQRIGLASEYNNTASGSEDVNVNNAVPTSITTAKATIEATGGDEGILWVDVGTDGADAAKQHTRAGGKGQPLIHVIHDTVIAGYHALLPPSEHTTDSHLQAIWRDAEVAASWIVQVVGDRTISTCQGKQCIKGNQVGEGLLVQLTRCHTTPSSSRHDNPSNEDKEDNKEQTTTMLCARQLQTRLQDLIAGTRSLNKANLTTLATPGLVISPAVIHTLRTLDPVPQALFVHKLAQALALQKVMDRAVLARRLLLTGAQVPLIANNAPAQAQIHQAVHQLEQSVNTLLWERRIRQTTLATPLQQLLQYRQRQLNASRTAQLMPKAAVLRQGSLHTVTSDTTDQNDTTTDNALNE